MMTSEEKEKIRKSRRHISVLAVKSAYYKKGDRRVTSPRVCSICGRPLSSYITNTGKYVTSYQHKRYWLDDMFVLNMCADASSCYRNYRKDDEDV